MPNRPNYLQCLVQGIITGMIFLPLLMVLHAIFFDPSMLSGIIILALMYGLPIGIWLGAAAGSAHFWLSRGKRCGAGMNCLVAGAMVLLFFWYFSGWADEVFRVFFVPIVAGLVFCLYGGWMLLTGNSER